MVEEEVPGRGCGRLMLMSSGERAVVMAIVGCGPRMWGVNGESVVLCPGGTGDVG